MLTALILAAGASTRLGQPKQLVDLNGHALINHTIQLAKTVSSSVMVITGANADQVAAVIAKDVPIVHANNWQQGMGSSLKQGIQSLPATSSACLVMTCDQWRLTGHDLQQLADTYYAQPERSVASFYANTMGIPAIFPRHAFSALQACDDQGAKSVLIAQQPITVSLPNAAYDLDTATDLSALKQSQV